MQADQSPEEGSNIEYDPKKAEMLNKFIKGGLDLIKKRQFEDAIGYFNNPEAAKKI